MTSAPGVGRLACRGGGIVLGFVLLGVAACSEPPATEPAAQPLSSGDRLALVSTRGYEDAGFHHVAGLVTNISDSSLPDVTAVVSWYTDWEDFITTREGRINVTPLAPGHTSPFDLRGPPPPLVARFSVQFKQTDGDTIPMADRR